MTAANKTQINKEDKEESKKEDLAAASVIGDSCENVKSSSSFSEKNWMSDWRNLEEEEDVDLFEEVEKDKEEEFEPGDVIWG